MHICSCIVETWKAIGIGLAMPNPMERTLRERKHHIYLSLEQRRELTEIINNDTPARARRARVLLLVDEGLHGPGQTLTEASERTGMHTASVSHLVERAANSGPTQAAIGKTGDASKGSSQRHLRALTDEQEAELTELFGSGQFTKAELARRAGVSNPTIGRILKRQQRNDQQHR